MLGFIIQTRLLPGVCLGETILCPYHHSKCLPGYAGDYAAPQLSFLVKGTALTMF